MASVVKSYGTTSMAVTGRKESSETLPDSLKSTAAGGYGADADTSGESGEMYADTQNGDHCYGKR